MQAHDRPLPIFTPLVSVVSGSRSFCCLVFLPFSSRCQAPQVGTWFYPGQLGQPQSAQSAASNPRFGPSSLRVWPLPTAGSPGKGLERKSAWTKNHGEVESETSFFKVWCDSNSWSPVQACTTTQSTTADKKRAASQGYTQMIRKA